MNNPSTLNRRQFLRTTGQIAKALTVVSAFAPAILSAPSAPKTIGVGCIGLGTRGGDLINTIVRAPNLKVTAVCDVYGPHRQKGIDRSRNPEVKAYADHRDLLTDPNVDAVVIATPDHWHCQMVWHAVRAGKDIYCEKGFSRTLAEAKLMRDALKTSEVVFQLGHQARQATCALQARELLGQDVLGPVTLVRTGRFKSTEPARPNWRWCRNKSGARCAGIRAGRKSCESFEDKLWDRSVVVRQRWLNANPGWCGVSQFAGAWLRPKWPGARREEGASPQWAVTDGQRSPRPFSAQPFGLQCFSPPALLLAPYRPLRVCASLAPGGRRKPLAAKHQPIARHHTSAGSRAAGYVRDAAHRAESSDPLWLDPHPRQKRVRC